jgi:PAS domain S-box-containing protein
VDRTGRVVRINSKLKIPGPGAVDLHGLLHQHCTDPGCYLARFWQQAWAAMANAGHSHLSARDPVLKRRLEIRTQMLFGALQANRAPRDHCALVTVDEVSESSATKNKPAPASPDEQRIREGSLPHEKLREHLFGILDKFPEFAAAADGTGVLQYVNPAGRAMLGMRVEDSLLGMTIEGCHAQAARKRVREEALPAARRDGAWSGHCVLLGRGGQEIRVYLTLIAHRGDDGRLEGFFLLGRDVGEWLRTEEALQVTQAQLWRLSARHLNIQESERQRIAVELHDGLGQTLSLVKLSIEEAAATGNYAASAGGSGRMREALERLRPQVKSALAELRRLAMNLRPSTLDDLGIVATLSWYFRELEAACPGIELERDVSVAEAEVPDALKISIFRIVQEATGNTLKHAKADRISVRLASGNGCLELSIEDNGRGFDPDNAAPLREPNQGLGLQGMKERAEVSGGRYRLRSAPGKGTRISVCWPLREATGLVCPVIPVPPRTAQAVCTSSSLTIPDDFSACLACVRGIGGR